MRHAVLILCLLAAFCGCATVGPPPVVYQNPVLAPPIDRDYFWDQLVAVVDQYFKIDREDRVRLVDNMLTLGRIDTAPELGATLLEPWRKDTVTYYDRLESTFQTIRRRARIQVVPTENGYLVDVQVFKELEDLKRPDQSNASSAATAFRNDDSLDRFNDQTQNPSSMIDSFPTSGRAMGPIGPQPFTLGWIPLGRDAGLEQKIIAELLFRLSPPGAPGPMPGAPCATPDP
jgi:hypothetical protein